MTQCISTFHFISLHIIMKGYFKIHKITCYMPFFTETVILYGIMWQTHEVTIMCELINSNYIRQDTEKKWFPLKLMYKRINSWVNLTVVLLDWCLSQGFSQIALSRSLTNQLKNEEQNKWRLWLLYLSRFLGLLCFIQIYLIFIPN